MAVNSINKIKKELSNSVPVRTLNSITKIQENQDNYVQELNIDDLIPAPKDWNFYDPISPTKMKELCESIVNVGILNPIVVWEQDDGKYMILSGHNRVKAYSMLRDTVNIEKYSKITATVKKKDEIDKATAKIIIVDTNWVQRELTTMQKAKSISVKYIELKQLSIDNNTNLSVNLNEIIGEEYNLSKRQVINYKSLSNLLPEFTSYIDRNLLSIKAGIKISKFPPEIQAHIYNTYVYAGKCKVLNANHNKLDANMTIEEINNVLQLNDKTTGKMIIQFPDTKKPEIYHKATLSYPKEYEKYFEGLVQVFCNSEESPVFKDGIYQNGDFSFYVK